MLQSFLEIVYFEKTLYKGGMMKTIAFLQILHKKSAPASALLQYTVKEELLTNHMYDEVQPWPQYTGDTQNERHQLVVWVEDSKNITLLPDEVCKKLVEEGEHVTYFWACHVCQKVSTFLVHPHNHADDALFSCNCIEQTGDMFQNAER